MDRETACFFTGHRAIPKNSKMEQILYDTAKELIRMGVTDFITGGARGFDTLSARTVIKLKEEYSHIKLHLYLPCYDQMSRWSSEDQYMGRMIMSFADEKIYVTEGKYVTGCMHLRNKKMARDAKYCIAYLKRPNSGTNVTVNYARNYGDIVYNIAEVI